MLTIRISQRRWLNAYNFSLLLSGAFLVFSIVTSGIGVKSNYLLSLGPGLYFIGAGLIFLTMVRSGGALAPISWYVLGTGIYFGLGAALWGLVPELHRNPVLHAGPGDLARVNLLNSASIFIVLLVAYFISARNLLLPVAKTAQKLNLLLLYKLLMPLAAMSVALDYYFFPIAQDLIVRSFQSKLSLVVPMYLLMTGILWKNIGNNYKLLSLIIVTGILILGVLSFSKTAVIYPILAMMAGYWVTNHSFRSLLAPITAMVIMLVLVLMPLVKGGRANVGYDAARNSIAERLDIVSSNIGGQQDGLADEPGIRVLSRFSHAPFQRFLIDEYLAGRSGETLADAWAALVPRIFWPDKPNITRFGVQLHELFFSIRGARSGLAPTYSAEAYWNYGALGVVGISILLGLQLGWLTKQWFYAIQGHRQGYLIIAFPAAFFGLNVETWIAASYFGGFVTLLIMWWLVELIISVLMKRSRQQRFA